MVGKITWAYNIRVERQLTFKKQMMKEFKVMDITEPIGDCAIQQHFRLLHKLGS